jgi:hypothetical protein
VLTWKEAETRKQSENAAVLLLIDGYMVELVDYLNSNRDSADRLAPSLVSDKKDDCLGEGHANRTVTIAIAGAYGLGVSRWNLDPHIGG